MEIVHLAAEFAPLVKVGGLGDVLQGLSRELVELGHKVRVFVPKYRGISLKGHDFHGVEVTLVDLPEWFDRPEVYGYEDDTDRFTQFCLAALEQLVKEGTQPNVLHLHDWHAAAAAPLVRTCFPTLTCKLLLTIHNLAYQGMTTDLTLLQIGLDPKKHDLNLLREGILAADHVTTVSPTYAQEILSEEGPLQQALLHAKEGLTGVLNGIDTHYWNPATDPYLPHHYDAGHLKGKAEVQRFLRAHLKWPEPKKKGPLVTAICRLTHQKAPELIKAAMLHTLKLGGEFILLGQASDPHTKKEFEKLKKQTSAHIELTFNEQLSHLVYAAADLLIVPSHFEPCGLTQMIAMRYGTVPLVRLTGGLADTVKEMINGFTFVPPTRQAIEGALDRAFHCYAHEPKLWGTLIQTGMTADFSWKVPAQAYLNLYKDLMASRL